MYAQILTNVNNRKLDRFFTYRVPEKLKNSVKKGSKVEIVFSGRILQGFVIALSEETEYTGTILDIRDVVRDDLVLSENQIDLAYWLADESFISLAKAFATIFPSVGIGRKDRKRMPLFLTEKGRKAIGDLRASKSKTALINLSENPGLQFSALNISQEIFRRLCKEEWIEFKEAEISKDPICINKLNNEQKKLMVSIENDLMNNEKEFLIHGVTGSGKTEIYFHLIKRCLEEGKQAMVLFPEIALTQEMVGRFKRAFGNRVRPWHSQLTPYQKKGIWDDLMQQKADILIGPRSASLVGMKNLGLIIVDEEHDASYLQSSTPCYDGRKVARYRATQVDAPLVMGSATPSVDVLYRVKTEEVKLYSLLKRHRGANLPQITTVDMREELKADNYSIFSRLLKQEIERSLEEKKGVLLFLNRRGYSGSFVCRDCGHTMMCENCDIPLTYHKQGDILKCHYCGYEKKAITVCPECKSKRIRSFGVGTQKVEQEVKNVFPNARVARIDGDTDNKNGARERLIEDLKEGRTDILIGTQIITKGIDFPKVGLVAVLAADLALNVPDFRAREKACQQLVQVAGRSGREDGMGLCLIQTYQPDNLAVQYAKEENYLAFVELEMQERYRMNYPPYSQTIRILISAEQEEILAKRAVIFSNYIPKAPFKVLGPVPANYSRIKGLYRWHIIILGDDLEKMKNTVQYALREFYDKENSSNIYFTIEVNPGSML
ncbi:primosomal protein N' [Clostridia bacterium]|nr:primosomal protein N' [Clostridia bacterium]